MSAARLLLFALGYAACAAWGVLCDYCSLMGEGLRQLGAGITGWDGED